MQLLVYLIRDTQLKLMKLERKVQENKAQQPRGFNPSTPELVGWHTSHCATTTTPVSNSVRLLFE